MGYLDPLPGIVTQAMDTNPRYLTGLYWAFCGDSITNGSAASNYAYSYGPKAAATVGGLVSRFDIVNAGKPGATSSDLLIRMPRILATGVNALVIMIGTNDAGGGIPLSTFVTNMTAILNMARSFYIPVVLCTIAARGSSAGAQTNQLLNAYNTWILTYGPLFGCIIADTYSATVDTTTGYLLSTYDSGDGTHPNDTGHNSIANTVAKAMIIASNRPVPRGLIFTGGTPSITNMVNDPLSELGTTQPQNWFEQPGGTGTAPTYSLVADTSSVLPIGKWAQMDFDGTTSGGLRRLATNGLSTALWNTGDTILLTSHIQIEDTSGSWATDNIAGNASVGISLVDQTGVSFSNVLNRIIGIKNSSGFYDIGPIVWPAQIPLTSTGINVWFGFSVPTGKHYKMRVGCVGVKNLTQLGMTGYYNFSSSAGAIVIQ